MKSSFYLSESQKILANAGSTEDVLRFLRANRASKIDSIQVLAELQNLPLPEAKRIVHYSPVWQDLRERDEEVQTDLRKAIHDLHEGADETEGLEIRGEDEKDDGSP